MDIYQQVQQLQAQVAELTAVINSLRNGSSIPFDIDAAFNDRFGGGLKLDSIAGVQYTKSVNEAGSDVYTVSKVMDGTAEATYNGTRIFIPFYV